ncbi:hypothetical protein J4032_27330 [Streptomyces formicae]|uniref:Uncharacterized protein n=1 Tax=Streptomyces formicae TaxID=1616117 RepID=A0ABY3WTP8_9ACTN|nr:hypothetical protein [Streptomyces formicae]UNM14677.1 hypothetical protein J4032_27330 [Streptomyces formicae]
MELSERVGHLADRLAHPLQFRGVALFLERNRHELQSAGVGSDVPVTRSGLEDLLVLGDHRLFAGPYQHIGLELESDLPLDFNGSVDRGGAVCRGERAVRVPLDRGRGGHRRDRNRLRLPLRVIVLVGDPQTVPHVGARYRPLPLLADMMQFVRQDLRPGDVSDDVVP